jgi:hypothetical protein
MSANVQSLRSRLIQAVVQAVLVVALFIGVVILLSGPSQRERRETNQNVRQLVMEAQKNREVLCIAVLHNPANEARNEPRLVQLCAELGVERVDSHD